MGRAAGRAQSRRKPAAPAPGSPQGREIGLDDRVIPSGLHHLVQEKTIPARPAAPPPRPVFRGEMQHGVPAIPGVDDTFTDPDDKLTTEGHEARRHGSQLVHHELPPPEPDPLPVYLVERREKIPKRREAITRAVTVAASGSEPTRICSEDTERVELRVFNESPVTAATPGGASTTTVGSVTSPAADQVITSQALTAGTWVIGWTVQLSGTLGAGDANNFVMESNNVQVAQSLNAGAAGTYTQPPVTVVIPAGGATVEIEALAVGTVGAVYQAQMTATPQATPGSAGTPIRLGNTQASVAGVTAAAPGDGVVVEPQTWTPPVKTQGELWAVAMSATPVPASVLIITEVSD